VIWIVSSLVSALAFARFYVYGLRHFGALIARPEKRRFNTPKIIFQITTRGNMPIVQETVDRIHSICRGIEYRDYDVWVVTEVEERFENCQTFTVPAKYSCNAIFK
jgi:hypothetical protein